MTEPTVTEADIRKAFKEAGIFYHKNYLNNRFVNAFCLALARRIAAEREAVPVAWLYEYADRVGGDTRVFEDLQQSIQYSRDAGWTETPLYAAPPKEPTT